MTSENTEDQACVEEKGKLEAIEKYFSLETVKDIVEAMESEASKLDEDCCTLAMK
uniref:Uncharacterized protein n=1 Tax=Oryza meridionalis TaxID=40149 RepID=A0A0E0E032_9ORYZ